ncbi:MAG: hypothetical protein LBQ69_06155 [Treponema sp.]|jgi:(p)ppGpp synthase/HD superfamily hydrolase|nr:hypothetical protein [Treponema sp.]
MTTEEMFRLRETHLAPYIHLATALIGKSRFGGGNMFRHQLDTMAILVDYGYIDSILLKGSIVHDVLEDLPDFNHNTLLSIDYESHQVYELVKEVTRNPEESKGEFLTRILETGSHNAKVLKAADRISNMISLGFVTNMEFISRYVEETERYVFPIAQAVNMYMVQELGTLVESRRKFVADFAKLKSEKQHVDSADFA